MENNSKNSRLASIAIMISTFLVIIVIIFIGFKKCVLENKCKSPNRSFETVIKAEDNKDGLHIESNKVMYSIYYKVPDKAGLINSEKEEFFNIDTTIENFENLSNGLESPFFVCNNQHNRMNRKVIYVVLDISKSVVNDIGNGYDGYFDQVASIIHTILSKEVLHPEDEIRIRFLGTNKDKVKNIDFTGPSFKYEISKNGVQKKNTLTLLSYSNEPLTKCDNNDSVVSVQGLIEKISDAYNQRKTTPDNNTYITSLLEKLSNEIILEKDNFKSVSYIIFTDGISDDGYSKCDSFSAEQCGEGFKELNMNNDPSNKVYLIWVSDSQKKEIFRRIFSGMLINFQ